MLFLWLWVNRLRSIGSAPWLIIACRNGNTLPLDSRQTSHIRSQTTNEKGKSITTHLSFNLKYNISFSFSLDRLHHVFLLMDNELINNSRMQKTQLEDFYVCFSFKFLWVAVGRCGCGCVVGVGFQRNNQAVVHWKEDSFTCYSFLLAHLKTTQYLHFFSTNST